MEPSELQELIRAHLDRFHASNRLTHAEASRRESESSKTAAEAQRVAEEARRQRLKNDKDELLQPHHFRLDLIANYTLALVALGLILAGGVMINRDVQAAQDIAFWGPVFVLSGVVLVYRGRFLEAFTRSITGRIARFFGGR